MKVLHIINDLNAGGAERLLLDILPVLNHFDSIEADLLLLTDKKNIFDKQLKEAGINVFVCKKRNVKSIFNIFDIRKFIILGNYSIVHVHLFPSNYWVALAKKLLPGKNLILIASEHSTYNKRRRYRVFQFIEKLIYKEFNYIISISNQTEHNLQRWLKIKQHEKKKFKVIENAIDIQKFKNAIPYAKKDLVSCHTNDVKLICMVGNFRAQKDQKTLITSMINLNEKIHLVLVGQGEKLEEMKRLAFQMKLTERIHFLGVRTDVERIIKTCDIIALSSHWEGFGLVAVEGMAAGKPVIVSNVDGLREVVKGAGLLFEKGNSEQFSSIVNKLLRDQNFYNNVAKKCSDKSELFDKKAMVEKIFQIYKSLSTNYEFS